MKTKMTAEQARELLFRHYWKATGAFQISKIIDALHKLGCTGMNDSQIEAVASAAAGRVVTIHVEDFHNMEQRIFANFGPLSVADIRGMEQMGLSTLESIELSPEPDYKQKLEEAMGLLEPIVHGLLSKEDNIDFLNAQVSKAKQFIEENKGG